MANPTVPCVPWRRAVLLGALLAAAPASPARAAVPRDAPTAPVCLADVSLPPFAGHALPLSARPDPQPMTLVRAFPSLPPFTRPSLAVAPPDGTRRLFVAERAGRILVFRADREATAARVFLDLRTQVSSTSLDDGVTGLAFDPDYAANGLFYVHYTAPASLCDGVRTCTRLVRYRTSADPDAADPASGALLLEQIQPAAQHAGGPIAFGPDRRLYVALGDGAPDGDPASHAQNLTTLLGKLLRIDPHGGSPYAIPPDNPFAGNPWGWRPEIWAYGLRQPVGLAFDAATGLLWLGDRGQSAWEEVNAVAAGGANLGWNACEGTHDAGGRRCRDLVSQAPALEYPHASSGGYAVTGGLVYRGDRLPTLFGAYVYADFSSGRLWAWDGARAVQVAGMNQIAGFAEGPDGELLVLRSSDGRLHRFQDTAFGASSGLPSRLSETRLFADVARLVPAPGLVPYDVQVAQSSDDVRIRRWLALPAGERVHVEPGGELAFPAGSVLVQHLELSGGASAVRLETRLLLRQDDRWIAFSYRWNAGGTDADLLTQASDGSFVVNGVPRVWHYPSPAECTDCHARSVGTVLGAKTAQLHLTWRCDWRAESQLAAWETLGLLDGPAPRPAPADTLVDPENPDARLGRRARALLEVRCASCHQPTGRAPGDMDLRWSTPLAEMRLVNVPVSNGTLGVPGVVRLSPGEKERSMLWQRVHTPDRTVAMPPLRGRVDPVDVALLGAWIDADPTRDVDGDGTPDEEDVCPEIFDPLQGDANRDDVGDLCDATCANGLDDDGDGRVDFGADPGCQNGESWAREAPACSDGLDNDGDGGVDWPRDETCIAPWQADEATSMVNLGCGLLGIEALAALALCRRAAARARRRRPVPRPRRLAAPCGRRACSSPARRGRGRPG